ncbi:MAG: hypothetical protein ACK5VI_09020, partial [Opitutia bacterium]
SDRLWEIFKDRKILCAEGFKLDQLDKETANEYISLSKLRYSNAAKVLGAGQENLSVYELVRMVYLKLSKGGKFNKSPNLIGKILVFFKELFLE